MKAIVIAMILPFCLGMVIGMSFIIAIELKKMSDNEDLYKDYDEEG